MTHFLKDQTKCKSDHSFLLKKSQIRGKNEEKIFHQTKYHYFLFINGETQTFPKSKYFLPNTILKRFPTFMWLLGVKLLPRGYFNLQFSYRTKRRTEAYDESRLNKRVFHFLSFLLYL